MRAGHRTLLARVIAFLMVFGASFGQESSGQTVTDTGDAVLRALDRLPSRCDAILLVINDKERADRKLAAKDAELQQELKERSSYLGIGAVHTAGLSFAEMERVFSSTERVMEELGTFAAIIVFCRSPTLDELGKFPETPHTGALFLTAATSDASKVQEKHEKLLAADFVNTESAGDLKVFRPKVESKRQGGFVLSGKWKDRYLLAVSSEVKDLDGLASGDATRENILSSEMRQAAKRHLTSLRETGLLQVIRQQRGKNDLISTYFPSAKDTVTEIRWHQKPIRESTAKNFQERIGKPIEPLPEWARRGVLQPPSTTTAAILNEHAYEVRRTASTVSLGIFYWMARIGENYSDYIEKPE